MLSGLNIDFSCYDPRFYIGSRKIEAELPFYLLGAEGRRSSPHGALISLSHKPISRDDVTHPQVAFTSVANAGELLEHRCFHLPINGACFCELKMCPQECMLSRHAVSPPHRNFIIVSQLRLPDFTFQLFCRCDFTDSCILTQSFFT